MKDVLEHVPAAAKHVGDVGAAGIAGIAFFSDVLPNAVILMSFIWFSMQMYTWVINKRWRPKKSD